MSRNKEFRSIIIKLILIQAIFSILIFFIMDKQVDKLKEDFIERDMALVGNLLSLDEDFENKIIPYFTKDISLENKNLGKEVLEEYGYNALISKELHPIFQNNSIPLMATMFTLFLLVPILVIVANDYKKTYKKVSNVSTAAEKVVDGDFDVYLKEDGEGEFNILNYQFNQMANRLENSISTLKKEKVFLKNIISDISHQLKTPLSSLIVINHILNEDENMNIETRKDFLEKEKNQLDRMEWLIINLLKLAKIESGTIEFKREKINISNLLDNTMIALNEKIASQEIIIEGMENSIIYGDENWIQEAFVNIIKNALEHSRGKIKVQIEDNPLFTNIKIIDNGIGIKKEHLPHIFERFFKVNSEEKSDSIGIGLNLAKLIIEAQNGSVSVKSQENIGTEFNISFLKTNN